MTVSPAETPTTLSANKALRRLFLTLFLRGRSVRGLHKSNLPTSLPKKLGLTLLFYALFGTIAAASGPKPTIVTALVLHTMTLLFLAMFIAASSGEILFNREEADILLSRPISARSLLWAKITVLLQVALWIAFSLNLVGFVTGTLGPDGSWLFAPVHALSLVIESLFTAAAVVLLYHLCLLWFGRERLDNIMTTAQVLVIVVTIAASQAAPFANEYFAHSGGDLARSWWLVLIPPAWFAGFDDALAGSHALTSFMLAGAGLLVTAILAWAAFDRLAATYTTNLQQIVESSSSTRSRPAGASGGRRWLERAVERAPLRWYLGDPMTRRAFLLCTAYLLRDRDTKLRVYPSIAPMLIIPFFLLLNLRQGGAPTGDAFPLIFGASYLALSPTLALYTLQYSQQFQACDIFRLAPITGPGFLCAGARRAVLLLIAFPTVLIFAIAAYAIRHNPTELLLLLPGVLALPLFAILPQIGGHAIPLSRPVDAAKSTSRGLMIFGFLLISLALSGIGWLAYTFHLLLPALLLEAIFVFTATTLLARHIAHSAWPAAE
ncbi:MAG TPA: hypothetical protein VHQ47_20150 [Phycisphaerae bacterium]|nr:hypothetical protein [Phycisphaerae bacterium]